MRNQKLQIRARSEMPADRIEREIDIDAPIDVVWTVITEPAHITGWFTDSAELDARPGGAGRFGWDVRSANREHTRNLRVERLEPPHFFSFRWNFPDGAEPSETNAPLVEFTLESRGDATHLRLVESGLDAIAHSDEARETYFSEHTRGWAVITERLREYAPKQRSTVTR
jgi:uncharacterized protein YndB with AHSA1/START domain